MTHWRARDGRILIRDANDEWHWVTPMHTRRSEHRLLCLIACLVLTLFFFAAVLLIFSRQSKADGLPQYGVNCADIVLMQHRFGIKNTLKGRVQARAIAATLGIWLSDEEIEEAARCMPVSTPKKDKG